MLFRSSGNDANSKIVEHPFESFLIKKFLNSRIDGMLPNGFSSMYPRWSSEMIQRGLNTAVLKPAIDILSKHNDWLPDHMRYVPLQRMGASLGAFAFTTPFMILWGTVNGAKYRVSVLWFWTIEL